MRRTIDDVRVMEARQLEVNRQLVGITSDHEKRIRAIERVVGYGLGAIGGIKIVYDLFKGLAL